MYMNRKFDIKRFQKVMKVSSMIIFLLTLFLASYFYYKSKTTPLSCWPYGDGEMCNFNKFRLWEKLSNFFLFVTIIFPLISTLIIKLLSYLFPKKRFMKKLKDYETR